MKKPTAPAGITVASQFRLGVETLHKLDAIAAAYAANTGNVETRTSVLRQLIHREYAGLAKKTGK